MQGLVQRHAWGARAPKAETPLTRSHVKGVAVHYTSMNADEQADHRNCASRVRGVQNYHMDHNGWNDIAYNFVVCKHGAIFVGRGWWNRSAAQGTNDGNDGYIAVCFLGDDTANRDDVTNAGRAAFQRVFKRFKEWYDRQPILRPHSAFHSTGCPGNELRKFISHL